MPHALAPGLPYNPRRLSWPANTSQYNYRGGEHELLLLFAEPDAAEVAAVATGEAEVALYVEQPVILLCYRFGDSIPWSDSPFTIHRVPAHERTLPPDEAQTPLRIVLVDAGTGIVRALRLVLLAPGFTSALHTAIRQQAALPPDERALDDIYRRYPDTAAMAAAAGHLTTIARNSGERREA